MIWSAHSEGVLQRSPCTTTPIAKADKFNYLNPIAAILNMANICVCISIKLGGRWNLIMTWPGITISHNILSLHSTTTHCWYYFTPLQHTVDIISHNHNTISLHTIHALQMQEKRSVRKFLYNCPNTISTFCKIWCNGYTDWCWFL